MRLKKIFITKIKRLKIPKEASSGLELKININLGK